jgi:hypothetical protein
MRIKSSEIELILESLEYDLRSAYNPSEISYIIALQIQWTELWHKTVELESNESILDWLETI